MIKWIGTVLFCYVFLLLIVSCDLEGQGRNFQKNDEQLDVPKFSIVIELTELAADKLKNAGESIEGVISFDGDGDSKGVNNLPYRDVYLGEYEFEIKEPGIVEINNAKISKEAYVNLTEKDYYYNVNVYSGRHVFKNNLLVGDRCYANGQLSDIKRNNVIRIFCELIDSEYIK